MSLAGAYTSLSVDGSKARLEDDVSMGGDRVAEAVPRVRLVVEAFAVALFREASLTEVSIVTYCALVADSDNRAAADLAGHTVLSLRQGVVVWAHLEVLKAFTRLSRPPKQVLRK